MDLARGRHRLTSSRHRCVAVPSCHSQIPPCMYSSSTWPWMNGTQGSATIRSREKNSFISSIVSSFLLTYWKFQKYFFISLTGRAIRFHYKNLKFVVNLQCEREKYQANTRTLFGCVNWANRIENLYRILYLRNKINKLWNQWSQILK